MTTPIGRGFRFVIKAKSGYGALTIEQTDLERLVLDIARAWKLDVDVASLNGLQTALTFRMLDLHSGALELAAVPNVTLDDLYKRLPYATLTFDVVLSAALMMVDRAANRAEHKWALLLDEFEIAHPALQRRVLASLRSANSKLLYKVALAPCGPHTTESLETLGPPSHKNDYKQTNLWHAEKLSALHFCEQLFYSRLGSYKPLAGKSPTQVFGSTWDGDAEDLTREEKIADRAGKLRQEFLELQIKDESFARFLTDKQIDPNALDTSLSLTRKIGPLVAFRNAHKGAGAGRKGRKKLLSIYTGWEALASISEGNPRWFIGMLNMIVSRHTERDLLPIDRSVQHDEVQEASEAFSAMLQTAATERAMGITTTKSVFELLSSIGTYFNHRLVDEEFIEEIPLSFDVNDVDADTEKALRIAINLGAVVSLSDPDDVGGFRTLDGKRFRLAYLLAPQFRLPLRSTKSVALSTILSRTTELSRGRRRATMDELIQRQGALF